MKWFYADQGQQIGPVEDADLDRLLSEGKITPATLVWRDGLANWQPLSEARPATPPPAPGGVRCDSCGNIFQSDDLITIEGRQICGACKPAFVQKLREGATLPDPVSVVRDGPAWEQRATLGFFKAILETLKGVLGEPAKTFAQMKCAGGLGTPLSYAVLLGTVGSAFGLFYNFAFNSFGPSTPEKQMLMHKIFGSLGMGFGFLIIAVLMPVFLTVGSFISAGITHLCLMMVGGAKRDFETTFRVQCYVSGSTSLLQIVPICGGIAVGIWHIVAMSIGLAKAHETTTGKAVAAVLLPMIVCCGAVFLVAMFAGVAIAGAAKAGH